VLLNSAGMAEIDSVNYAAIEQTLREHSVEAYGKTCEALFKTLSPSRKSD